MKSVKKKKILTGNENLSTYLHWLHSSLAAWMCPFMVIHDTRKCHVFQPEDSQRHTRVCDCYVTHNHSN